MSKKFRRFYETAFDSKISKSDDDLLSSDKQDAAIAHRLSNQLKLSASTSSVLQLQCNDGGGRAPLSKLACKNRLFRFLLQKRRGVGDGGGDGGGGGVDGVGQSNRNKYRSSDSVVTSSSLSLESITSDSLSSHSSESPCYKRYPEPHVLSPISDKSSQDAAAGVEIPDYERRQSSAAAAAVVRAKPPQSLGLIKLNGDHHQHHGSDSGISVGSKPGDNYQELLDVPFDMPKLRRKQKPDTAFRLVERPAATTADGVPELPFDMPKLRRTQCTNPDDGTALPFDMPKLRKRQMDSCARVISLDFEIGDGGSGGGDGSETARLGQLPFDIPKLKKIASQKDGKNKLDRSGLFLDVNPNSCGLPVDANNRQLPLKSFQNKSQPNRPTLSLSNIKPLNCVEDIDVSLPLDQQCWYHGSMNRHEAEKALLGQTEGSYLVRGNKGSYALSIKSAKGFIHMRITQSGERNYLGQSDRPFHTIPDLVRHYTLNKLPAKGAEHVGLIRPLAHQIL